MSRPPSVKRLLVVPCGLFGATASRGLSSPQRRGNLLLGLRVRRPLVRGARDLDFGHLSRTGVRQRRKANVRVCPQRGGNLLLLGQTAIFPRCGMWQKTITMRTIGNVLATGKLNQHLVGAVSRHLTLTLTSQLADVPATCTRWPLTWRLILVLISALLNHRRLPSSSGLQSGLQRPSGPRARVIPCPSQRRGNLPLMRVRVNQQGPRRSARQPRQHRLNHSRRRVLRRLA